MFFEKLKTIMNEVGENLSQYDFESHTTEEVIQDVLEIETTLFRARIKAEHELNVKRF